MTIMESDGVRYLAPVDPVGGGLLEQAWVDFADDDTLMFFVPGKPLTKGNLTGFKMGNRIKLTEKNGAEQREWVAFVRDRAQQMWGDRAPISDAVRVVVDFVMPRRATAPKRSTPAHTRKPDGDKLTRCVWDALTHVVFVDDAQVVQWAGSKREAEIGEVPGARIQVQRLR